jgi:DNA-binding LytR/AlgR family response regulator
MNGEKMIRIAIVEDDSLFYRQMQQNLERYQRERGEALSVTVFNDGEEILERYGNGFDIILMDIQLQYLDGMKTAEGIRQQDSEVVIIFITSTPQYAIKGYAVGAMDYILKPVSYFALSQRLDKAISQIKKKTKHYIMVSAPGETKKVDVSSIYYVESRNHTLTFHTKDGEFASYGTMQRMEQELSESGAFYRCNKGCLVNLEHVDAIRENCAIVGKDTLPISRGKKAGMMSALVSYVNGVLR